MLILKDPPQLNQITDPDILKLITLRLTQLTPNHDHRGTPRHLRRPRNNHRSPRSPHSDQSVRRCRLCQTAWKNSQLICENSVKVVHVKSLTC